jgi:serine/threonine protein kinase/tetratricopeptide (TPR) repeat protein
MSDDRSKPSEWNEASVTVRRRSDDLLDIQNQRWQEGRPSPIEDFMRQDPELQSNAELMLDLIYNEVRLREEAGQAPDLDDYRRRFPELKPLLDIQFEVHEAMGRGNYLPEMSLDETVLDSPWAARPLPSAPGYEVLAELGRGAMGVVYKARHLRLNRLVALKMILTGDHAGARERARFEAEARAIARLQHPHIVQIYEFGEHEGRPYVCLELASAGNLAQRLQKQPLSTRSAAALLEMLARAVHFAHEQQIVHRDLKPGNILLVPSDARRGVLLTEASSGGYFEPKIADFGLAKLLDLQQDVEAQTTAPGAGRPIGTPPYMAPEQASRSGKPGQVPVVDDGRLTDIYALGAILYELLTGRPPFLGPTVLDTLQQVVSHDPLPPRRLQPKVPRDLEIICLACLRKEPRRRYHSALALAEDLRRFLGGKPIQQNAPALWEPPLKWAKRRPAAAAWVAVAVAACVGLGLGSLYYLDHRAEWALARTRGRFRDFTQSRDEALFQGSLLAAQDESRNDWALVAPDTVAASARLALDRAGVDSQGVPTLARDSYLTTAQKQQLENDCYELSLTLAEAIGHTTATMTLAERHSRATQGLQILEQARLLAGNSMAFHKPRAKLLALLGDAEGAKSEQRMAEELHPGSASDLMYMGLEQFHAGNLIEACRLFNQTLRLNPNHFEAQVLLAFASLNLNRPREAHLALNACIAQKPEFAWVYLLRGIALVEEEAFDDALADFAKVATLNPSKLLQYEVFANRGRLWLRRGKLEVAIAEFQAAAKLRPQDCHPHLQLARAFEKLERFAEADREMDEAGRLRPDLALVPRQHGTMRKDRRQWDAAFDDFQRAIQLELAGGKGPELVEDYVRCGSIRHFQGRFAEALIQYDAALRIRSDHPLASYLRGESLLATGRSKLAEQAFNQCLEKEPEYGPALRARGQARMQLGDYPGAIEDYSQAVRLKRDASILLHRGWAYFFTDAWRMAEHDFEEAMRIEESLADAQIGRGLTRVMLGAYKPAIADARAVLERQPPKQAEMMYNLACIFSLAAGRVHRDATGPERAALEAVYCGEALATLQKALELVPETQRSEYWMTKMCPDSALDPIRLSTGFVKLDTRLRAQGRQPENELKSGSPDSRQIN